MSHAEILCSYCGLMLSNLPEFPEVTQCPKCGSADRSIIAADTLEFHEQLKLSGKDPKQTGKRKVRREVISGDDLHIKSGKWYKKERIVDKDSDEYMEKVADPETGEVIHYCKEPLSQHRGDGSAKRKV